MFYIKILVVFLIISAFCEVKTDAESTTSKLFEFNGNVSVVVILNEFCPENSSSAEELISYSQRTLITSAIAVAERINFLDIISPLTLGLSIYQCCSEKDLLKTIFDTYEDNSTYPLGLVMSQEPSDKVKKFSEILGMRTKRKKKIVSYLVRAAVDFLSVVGWKSNVTLVTTDEEIGDLFYFHAKKRRICVNEFYIVDDARSLSLNATAEDPLVFFGTASDINRFFINDTHLASSDVLFVPVDGDVPIDLPEGSFVILPPHTPTKDYKTNTLILPTPLLFDIADPIINLAVETKNIMSANCNDTIFKIDCLKRKPYNMIHLFPIVAPVDILKSLKLDPLKHYIGYDIYRIESSKTNHTTVTNSNIFLKPFRKIFNYNMFYDNLTLVDDTFEMPALFNNDTSEEGFWGDVCNQEFIIIRRDHEKVIYRTTIISFRTEAWIYAFLSLSLLGVLFCIAILVFLLVALFQRRILEGNPVLTLLLLFAVMLVFCSVLPFCIQTTKSTHKAICIIKSLAVTLSYAAVFSLLLSRSIVLGSAAKEVGFMSHIAGPVQSFLCLFVFCVQVAMSLHVIGRCNNIFTHGYDFVYLMSYNTMLLLLLVCLTPLIYKSQRNYREGKYFTIAIVLITLVWSIWLPGFTVLCSEWRELMVCLGLVATGGICLGTIFVPRTYLMTIAAERDKITNALPSLATATSALDIYRAHTQPIYDCVNFAAINAAAVARAGVAPTAPATTLQQPDLYSCPALPEDIDFDLRCESPTNTDKVTRF